MLFWVWGPLSSFRRLLIAFRIPDRGLESYQAVFHPICGSESHAIFRVSVHILWVGGRALYTEGGRH
jgi:hypothetical protein